ncbi:MAG: prepilin-type N-terminal cleavage/methylation domain-containing protein [Verrucomicrobiota bacterium]
MSSGHRHLKQIQNGFSLIELLAAMAVLAIMFAILGQIFSLASKSMSDGKRRVDHFSTARSALDLIATDIQSGIFRDDLPAFRDASGATAPVFYTSRSGIGGDRELSLIRYQLDTTESILQRGSLGVNWAHDTNTLPIGFNLSSQLPLEANISTSQVFDVAFGALALEIYFLNSDGSITDTYSSNARTLIVSIAVADEKNLNILKQSGQINTLVSRLNKQTILTERYRSYWDTQLNDPSFLASVSVPARQSISIFERSIKLP